ncbi:MAG: putative quinol monooxygenase [Lawsonibacter sp.]
MYGINVIYTMKPGKRDEFLAGVTASGAQAAVRGEEGCLQYDYFTSVDDPDKLLLLEKWTNRGGPEGSTWRQPHMALIQEV